GLRAELHVSERWSADSPEADLRYLAPRAHEPDVAARTLAVDDFQSPGQKLQRPIHRWDGVHDFAAGAAVAAGGHRCAPVRRRVQGRARRAVVSVTIASIPIGRAHDGLAGRCTLLD